MESIEFIWDEGSSSIDNDMEWKDRGLCVRSQGKFMVIYLDRGDSLRIYYKNELVSSWDNSIGRVDNLGLSSGVKMYIGRILESSVGDLNINKGGML